MPGPTPDSPRDVRPTLEAVAALAGVSRATASRVVNGGAGVRQPLVEQVRKAVAELGYVPNHAARTLVTRRNGAVAVIIDEPEFRIFSDPFFSQEIRGISRELSVYDAQLVLLLVEGSGDFDRVARYLAGGHVDGALAFSLHMDDELPSIIRRFRVPTVYGGRPGRVPRPNWPFPTSTATTGAAQPRPYAISSPSAVGGSRTSQDRATRHRHSTGSTATAMYCPKAIRHCSRKATSPSKAAHGR